MTLRVTTANTDWAARGDGGYVRELAKTADVLLLQEAKDFTLARVLPEGWRALQDTSSPARAGSCIAVRKDAVEVLNFGLELGVKPYVGDRRFDQLTRYLAIAQVRELSTGRRASLLSGHAPKKAFAPLRPRFRKNLRRAMVGHPQMVAGLDANQDYRSFGDDVGWEAYGEGIICVLTDLPVSHETARRVGLQEGLTDHPAYSVHVTIPPRKEPTP